MATALYLEHYLDSLETLPSELQRNFTLMRQLDMNVRDEIKSIDEVSQNFLRNVRGMAPKEKTEILEGIKKRYKKVEELADDKVQLAMQTYEMVDKHIRRLDSDLARFEADLNGNPHMNADGEGLSKKKGRKALDKSEKKKGRGKRQADDDDSNKASKKKSKVQGSMSEGILPLPSLSLSHASDVLDMPVDPNEPTYCLCHQVSYGEMIGCDNPDCPIEWFHFACVGLSVKPKGKWYCPKCLAERKKK